MRTIGALALEEMIMATATAMVGLEVMDQVQGHRNSAKPSIILGRAPGIPGIRGFRTDQLDVTRAENFPKQGSSGVQKTFVANYFELQIRRGLVRKCQQELGLDLLGRHYFDHMLKVPVPAHRLEMASLPR
jgi:hypothetical protein